MATRARPKAKASAYDWAFKPRFRRRAFGWRSQPAITRVKQAVTELKKVARTDPLLAGEGAVLFLERVSPAIEQVDGSSGSMGSAVNHAVAECATIIGAAPADADTRASWLERLWDAYQDDEIPYIESLGDHWGELCATKELASVWADRLSSTVKMAWSPDPELRGFFKGTSNCLSALLFAERHDDIFALLALAPYRMWDYEQYGVRALAAQGRIDEAIARAQERRGRNDSDATVARTLEELMRAAGRMDDAYRYGLTANTSTTYLATFRALLKRYPSKRPAELLDDLVKTTPGDEGKWFAAAKDAELFDEALALARRTPCNPRTLANAARDHAETHPAFATNAGLLALSWLAQGFGWEITGGDVTFAYEETMRAAEHLSTKSGRDAVAEVRARVKALLALETPPVEFMRRFLDRRLGP